MRHRPMNGRIGALRVKTKYFNVWLINAYAPKEYKDDSVEDGFYSNLEPVFDSLPSNDVKYTVTSMQR